VSERLRRAHRGVRGGVQGGGAPRVGFGGSAPEFFFSGRHISAGTDIFPLGRHISRHIIGTTYFRDHMILGGFLAHGFLPMVFYFQLRN
jgi:hypothetical protein